MLLLDLRLFKLVVFLPSDENEKKETTPPKKRAIKPARGGRLWSGQVAGPEADHWAAQGVRARIWRSPMAAYAALFKGFTA